MRFLSLIILVRMSFDSDHMKEIYKVNCISDIYLRNRNKVTQKYRRHICFLNTILIYIMVNWTNLAIENESLRYKTLNVKYTVCIVKQGCIQSTGLRLFHKILYVPAIFAITCDQMPSHLRLGSSKI